LVAVISVGAALLVAAAMHAQDCVAGAAILTDSMAADTTHGACALTEHCCDQSLSD
jgi:hypothetical protein